MYSPRYKKLVEKIEGIVRIWQRSREKRINREEEIVYEPWHYRYIGKEAAAEIYTDQICLEEYMENAMIN